MVIGAGLAGLAAASALAERGFQLQLLERKSIPGGRASSYDAQDTDETVDNCQHILMRCCTNLLQFYGQAGVEPGTPGPDGVICQSARPCSDNPDYRKTTTRTDPRVDRFPPGR